VIEVGYRAAAALRRSPHELLFEFSRGYVMRCGGEIVWFDEDPEAFSPRGVLLCRTGNPACPDRQDCLSYNDFFNNAVAQFLLTRNPQILLGLGHGLTPSGDDFLGGWHLVRHRLGHRETLDMSATHEISRARLQMHLNGEGTRAEIRFVDALLNGGDVENAAQILRNHGHSSGDDFMRGARAALQ
jgi:hypothetical protein